MIDQLVKRKYLQQLRTPAQTTDQLEDPEYDPIAEAEMAVPTDDAGSVEPLDIQGELPVPGRSEFVRKERPNNMIADALAGAAPALLGLLSGNARSANAGFNQSNAYMKGLAAQDKVDAKNLVKTVDENGYPIYTPATEAAGAQVYAPTKASSSKSNGTKKLFESVADPTKTMWAGFNEKGQPVNPYTQEVMGSDKWQPSEKVSFQKTMDKYGNEVSVPVAGRSGKPIGDQFKTKEGQGESVTMGDQVIQIPEEKVKQAREVVAKAIPTIDKYQGLVTELSMSRNQIADKNSPPQIQKLAIGKVMKTVESRMTEGDRIEYKGEYSALLNIKQRIDMLKTDLIPEPLRLAFVKASDDMLNAVKYTSNSYRSSIVRSFAGNNKAYDKYIQGFLSPMATNVPYNKNKYVNRMTDSSYDNVQPPIAGGNVAPEIEARKKLLLEEQAKRANK